MTTSLLRHAPAKRTKATAAAKTVAKTRKKQLRRNGDRRESKTVREFKRWLLANAESVGKWARANTKRLTGREII